MCNIMCVLYSQNLQISVHRNTVSPNSGFPVVSSQVDSTRSVHHVDGSSHGQFNTGRFIPGCQKQLAVGAVLTGFVRRSHTTSVSLIYAFVQWMSATISNMLTQYEILKLVSLKTQCHTWWLRVLEA